MLVPKQYQVSQLDETGGGYIFLNNMPLLQKPLSADSRKRDWYVRLGFIETKLLKS
jgi:hypothetical protein